MKKALKYLFILFFAISSMNCVPVLVGGLILKSTKTQHEKQVFITEFNKNNLEREKAGLCRLDLCLAKFQFDKGWAYEDENCRAKIAAFEHGEIDECGRIIK